LGDKVRLPNEWLYPVLALHLTGGHGDENVLDIEDPDDRVHRVLDNGIARVAELGHESEYFLEGYARRDAHDLSSGSHRLRCQRITELKDLMEQLFLFLLERAPLLAEVDHRLDVLFRDHRPA